MANNAKIRRQQVFKFSYLPSKEDQSYFDGETFVKFQRYKNTKCREGYISDFKLGLEVMQAVTYGWQTETMPIEAE